MSNNKNKNYYKKNYYKNNHPKKDNNVKRVTYESLLKAEVIADDSKTYNIDKTLIMKYIAVTIVLFTIIICSIILFKNA